MNSHKPPPKRRITALPVPFSGCCSVVSRASRSKRKPPERNVMKYLAGNSAHCGLMPANFTNSCSLANLACYLSTATKASTDGEDAIALTARVSCFHSRSPAAERIDRARRWFRTRCRRPCARGLFCLQRDIRAGSPTATESKRRFHVRSTTVRIFAKS